MVPQSLGLILAFPVSYFNKHLHFTSIISDTTTIQDLIKEISFYPISSLNMGIELPSIPSPMPKPSKTSSANTGSDYIIDATSSAADEYEIAPEFPLGNSGLLEDLVEKSQADSG
ncbi:unnamed protein product [Ilex paraguariensis]|uniref:Uncharacterized protein n=1 Tax=Ilex paraguariensis TaxID=185542 RepID=A0ABC8SJE8_9AQUA